MPVVVRRSCPARPGRARAFYQKTLGLRLLTDDRFALAFDSNGVQLRIQKVEKVTPPPFAVLGWEVPSIRRAISALAKSGVRFERYPFLEQDEAGVATAPGEDLPSMSRWRAGGGSSGVVPLPPGRSSLQDFSTLNQPNHNHDDRHHQEDVNQAAGGVRRDHPQDPENDQNQYDGPQHVSRSDLGKVSALRTIGRAATSQYRPKGWIESYSQGLIHPAMTSP